MKRLLYFGGSFDPIHNAHLKLASLGKDALNCQKCFFVLAKNPRWKDPTCSAEDRLKMLRLAIKGHPGFAISLIEYNSDKDTTYTYDTVKTILKYHKNDQLFYLIGSDQLEKLDKWYKIDELSKMIKFVVFRRSNYPLNEENMKRYDVTLLNAEEMDISSTKIRLLNNLDCPKPVLDYIAKYQLYYTSLLKNYISSKRLNHCFSVASLAYDIALANHKDPYKAYHAGLIHDIAKGLNKEKSLELMQKYFPSEIGKVGEWGYHQFLAVVIAKDILKITDEEVLEAIEYHATGKKHMTPLAKIIYCADKIDPTRGYDSSKLIKKCKEDYKEGFKAVLKANIAYFKEKGIDYLNDYSKECFEYYLGETD